MMRFTHPKVIEYVFSEGSVGLVATLRTFKYKEGRTIRVWVGNKMFYGDVLLVADATRKNMEKFLEFSGFGSVDEWWEAALKLHKRKPKYIVLVKLWG